MVSVKLSGVVDEHRQLIVVVPENIPSGKVEVVINAQSDDSLLNPAREEIKQKLLKAGIRVVTPSLPPNFTPLSSEEILEIGHLSDDAISSEKLIDEDREER